MADRRTVGLDLGERRIGVAVCDSGGMLATPYEVLARSGDRGRDHRAIAAIVDDVAAVRVVVGLPRSLDGSKGAAATNVLDEIEQLRSVLPVPVLTHDERLTTVTAQRSLRGAGLDGRKSRKVIDQVAATVILQAWLEAEDRSDLASSPSDRRADA